MLGFIIMMWLFYKFGDKVATYYYYIEEEE